MPDLSGDAQALIIEIEPLIAKLEILSEKIETEPSNALEVGVVIDALQDIKARLGYIEASLSEVVLKSFKKKEKFAALPNGTVVERTWNQGRRKWDHDRLRTTAVEAVMKESIDPETGAIEAPFSQIAMRLFDLFGIGYWRVTALEEVDIDADSFSEKEAGKHSLRFHKSAISGTTTLGASND